MSSPDFQWFVAWRYLLERPRQLSGAILTFVALFVWLGMGVGLSIVGYPLTSSFYVPGPTTPQWVPPLFGLALAAVPVCLIVAMVAAAFPEASGGRFRWGRMLRPGRQSTALLLLAAYAGLIALAAVGVYAWLRAQPPLDASSGIFDLAMTVELLRGLLAIPLLFTFLRWMHGAEVPTGHFVVLLCVSYLPAVLVSMLLAAALGPLALLIIPASLLPVLLVFLFRRALRRSLLARVLAQLIFAANIAPLFLAAILGVLSLVEPQLTAGFGVLAAAAAIAVIAPFALGAAMDRNPIAANWALLGVALVCAGVAAYAVLPVGDFIFESVALLGGFGAVKTPMWLVIPGAIAGALIPLTLLLLGIRYVFTFFTTVSIGGVAIGSMALVVVLSVMSGFESDLREKILGSNAHIQVTLDHEAQMPNYRQVMQKIAQAPGVVAQMPYLVSEVVVSSGGNYYNVIIKGVDPATVGAVTDLDENLDAPDAIDRLWPLAADGSVIGAPAPAEPAEPDGGDGDEPAPDLVDPAPDDLTLPDDQPIDWSGAGAADAPPGSDAAVVDRAPPELDLPPDAPIDFSGGGDGELWPGEDEDAGEPPIVQDDPEGGIDSFSLDDEVEEQIRDYIPPQVAVLPGVLVGSELVKQIHLYPGQEVKIVSPLAQDTPIGPVPRTKPMRVAGIFFTGMYEYDLKLVYVELGALQDFLDLGDEVNGIEIRVQDPETTTATVAALRAALGEDFEVRDWKELNKSLFSALKLEKIAMFLVLVIIILVASFSIVGNLIMVVVEKAREIAVLKTLGASDRGVMKIFVVQGFFIGLVGTALGVSLGLTICWLLMRYGLPLDPDVYYIDRLPVHVEPLAVCAVAVAGVLISVIATVYPAFVASRLRPVQGLRYE